MFSKACEYGIKAVLYIATQSLDSKRVKIVDVANNADSPEAFTAKILGKLTKAGIVNSYKGPNGGFEIEIAKIKSTRISEIVYLIDGDNIYNGCALGLHTCDDNAPCPIHDKFRDIREQLKHMLNNTSIYELATGLMSGDSTLMRQNFNL